MAEIDRDILLEALSALTGADVKHHHEMKPHHQPHQILQLEHFLHTIISKKVRVIEAIDATDAIDENDEIDDMSLVKDEFFVDIENFFDPYFDYDFRDMKESSTCRRGGEEYRRPIGWYRFALKVLGIYSDKAWLGTDGWRSESVPGEWPVSFHGTTIENAKGIAEENYKPGPRGRFDRGIYSTPSIVVAEGYTEKFTSEKTGKKYEVIMQNRINLQNRKIINKQVAKDVVDHWLIPVPKDTPPEEEKKIVHRSIRPYGILIKEVI